jgi:branched-chain amino acid transport system permease protein
MNPDLKLFIEQLINGITVGSLYAMIALGYSMVYGVLAMINFAHGDIFMVGAYWGFFTLSRLGDSGWLAAEPLGGIILAFLCGALGAALTGITVERLAYRPLRKAGRLAPLISAIGASIVLQELVRLAPKIGNAIIHIHIGSFQLFPAGFIDTVSSWLADFGGSAARTYPTILGTAGFTVSGIFIPYVRVLIVVLSLLLMLILSLMVKYTRMGRAMRAVAESKDTAALMGVDVNQVIQRTFFIGSALAGIAGVMVGLMYLQIRVDMGFVPGIKAFTAAVLGGIGSIPGAMLGGYVLGLAESLAVQVLPAVYKDVVAFMILILTLLFLPSGLLGSRKASTKM